jgi:hypothetical protein
VSLTVWDLVEVRPLSNDHRGLFARRDIPRGQMIGCFDGRAVLFPVDKAGHIASGAFAFRDLIQLERVEESVLALAPVDGFEGIDFANHSCKPNASLKRGVVMVTRRRIRAGEEITLDYRKMDVVPEGIECWCDVPKRCLI